MGNYYTTVHSHTVPSCGQSFLYVYLFGRAFTFFIVMASKVTLDPIVKGSLCSHVYYAYYLVNRPNSDYQPQMYGDSFVTQRQTVTDGDTGPKSVSSSHPPPLREKLSSRSISIISESLPLSSPLSVVNSASSWLSSFLNPFLERLDMPGSIPFLRSFVSHQASNSLSWQI